MSWVPFPSRPTLKRPEAPLATAPYLNAGSPLEQIERLGRRQQNQSINQHQHQHQHQSQRFSSQLQPRYQQHFPAHSENGPVGWKQFHEKSSQMRREPVQWRPSSLQNWQQRIAGPPNVPPPPRTPGWQQNSHPPLPPHFLHDQRLNEMPQAKVGGWGHPRPVPPTTISQQPPPPPPPPPRPPRLPPPTPGNSKFPPNRSLKDPVKREENFVPRKDPPKVAQIQPLSAQPQKPYAAATTTTTTTTTTTAAAAAAAAAATPLASKRSYESSDMEESFDESEDETKRTAKRRRIVPKKKFSPEEKTFPDAEDEEETEEQDKHDGVEEEDRKQPATPRTNSPKDVRFGATAMESTPFQGKESSARKAKAKQLKEKLMLAKKNLIMALKRTSPKHGVFDPSLKAPRPIIQWSCSLPLDSARKASGPTQRRSETSLNSSLRASRTSFRKPLWKPLTALHQPLRVTNISGPKELVRFLPLHEQEDFEYMTEESDDESEAQTEEVIQEKRDEKEKIQRALLELRRRHRELKKKKKSPPSKQELMKRQEEVKQTMDAAYWKQLVVKHRNLLEAEEKTLNENEKLLAHCEQQLKETRAVVSALSVEVEDKTLRSQHLEKMISNHSKILLTTRTKRNECRKRISLANGEEHQDKSDEGIKKQSNEEEEREEVGATEARTNFKLTKNTTGGSDEETNFTKGNDEENLGRKDDAV